ncbi:glycosyltransferase family 2 protein [Zhihengliuella flava]|uniref:Glycosyltransferase 2-like domain-containing protein n=1 Tax=Zhihengliuella flava TaxID=1285193 RepID=A0A931GEH6_9MICC|nr:hypothetical protein [Zhihengliuella flava]
MGARENELISVVIATRNRDALLAESLTTVLNQTHRALDVVVVDDGVSGTTERLVESFADPRLRYLPATGSGAAAARNQGARAAAGEWIAVHDDDDLMLPRRIAEQVEAIDASADIIHGAFVNFDAVTGELTLHPSREVSIADSLMSGYAPGHGTWLVRAELMRRMPYNESLTAAIDNDVALRWLANGVRFVDAGVICQLRRVHAGSITGERGAAQKRAAEAGLSALRERFSSQMEPRHGSRRKYPDFRELVAPFLPDALLGAGGQHRSGYACSLRPGPAAQGPDGAADLVHYEAVLLSVSGLSWREFYEVAGQGYSVSTVRVVNIGEWGPATPGDDAPDWAVAGALMDRRDRRVAAGPCVVVRSQPRAHTAVADAIRASEPATPALSAHSPSGRSVTIISYAPGGDSLISAARLERHIAHHPGVCDVVVLTPA